MLITVLHRRGIQQNTVTELRGRDTEERKGQHTDKRERERERERKEERERRETQKDIKGKTHHFTQKTASGQGKPCLSLFNTRK